MVSYSYKAISGSGKRIRGVQDAASQAELEFSLQRNGLYLIDARESRTNSSSGKIRRRELITLFFNLDHLLRAGIPLLDCLGDLRDSMDVPQFRNIMAELASSVESGATLSQAMARHPRAFDRITASLVHAGEESGRLPEIFGHITASLKWQDELAAQTRNMMIYPLFAGALTVTVTFFLMYYLVPQLAGLIRSMGQTMPPYTRLLLDVSGLITGYWHVMLVLSAVIFGIFWLALKHHPALHYRLDGLKLRLWPVGPILHKIILARFANTFAMMYSSGISILDCLANSRDLAGNRVITRSLEQAAQEIEAGRSLSHSLHGTGIFPPLVIRMLKVGEASGQLDVALRNVSYFYEREVRESSKRLQALLEPAMTVALGMLLGWVMLSVLSPIYDIISEVGL